MDLSSVRSSVARKLAYSDSRFHITYDQPFVEECVQLLLSQSGYYTPVTDFARKVLVAANIAILTIHHKQQPDNITPDPSQKHEYVIQG